MIHAKYFNNLKFMARSVSTGNDIYVRFNKSQGINDQLSLSNFVKLGHIPGTSIRGWIRASIEALLIMHGISPCHPVPRNTMTNPRNKKLFEKNLEMGYHARGACKDHHDGCVVRKLFGDLDLPGNLMVDPVMFYPATNGGTILRDLQKIYNCVGTGRLEIQRASPRDRSEKKHTPYLTTESTVGIGIQAPFSLKLHQDDETQEIILLKALELLNTKILDREMGFMLGGKRNVGNGMAFIVVTNEKDSYIVKGRNILGIDTKEFNEINEKFAKIITEEKKKFPLGIELEKKAKDKKKDEKKSE